MSGLLALRVLGLNVDWHFPVVFLRKQLGGLLNQQVTCVAYGRRVRTWPSTLACQLLIFEIAIKSLFSANLVRTLKLDDIFKWLLDSSLVG
jgi:hypothetical protein